MYLDFIRVVLSQVWKLLAESPIALMENTISEP